MTVSFSKDPEERARVINETRKTEQDMYDFATLTQKIGMRAAYEAVYGIDDPSLDESSEQSKEEIALIKERYGMDKKQGTENV